MLAIQIGAEFDQDIARRVGLLGAGAESVGFQRAFDQPAGVEIPQTVVVMNRHRARPAGAKLFR